MKQEKGFLNMAFKMSQQDAQNIVVTLVIKVILKHLKGGGMFREWKHPADFGLCSQRDLLQEFEPTNSIIGSL